MKILSLVGLLLTISALAYAQEPSPPARMVPPSGPLIQKRAPDLCRWTVTMKTAPAGSETPAPPPADASPEVMNQRVLIKTGDLIRVDYTNEQKMTVTTWIVGMDQMVVWPGGKEVGFVAKPGQLDVNPYYLDLSQSDFPGFAWISPRNYTGTKQVAGKACLVFADTVMIYGLPVPIVAEIDLKTRLPVQLQNENGLTIYEFDPIPATAQNLPANVQKLLADRQNKEKALAHRPSPAF